MVVPLPAVSGVFAVPVGSVYEPLPWTILKRIFSPSAMAPEAGRVIEVTFAVSGKFWSSKAGAVLELTTAVGVAPDSEWTKIGWLPEAPQAEPLSMIFPFASNFAQSPEVSVPEVVPTTVVFPERVPLVKPPEPLLKSGVFALPDGAAA